MQHSSDTLKQEQPERGSLGASLLLLPSRLVIFLLFQLLIAWVAGSFAESQKYWLVTASATNIVSIALLVYLFRKEGRRFISIFYFRRDTLKKDILLFALLTILCVPVVLLPNYGLSIWLWSDASIPYQMLFQPIHPPLAIVLLFVFPVSIAFAELSTYFVYIMPRLKEHVHSKWLAVALPVFFLSVQHCTLPFIPDVEFIVYRGLMYLPFACVIGIALYYRPSLFPYFAVLHGLLDFGTVMVLVGEL